MDSKVKTLFGEIYHEQRRVIEMGHDKDYEVIVIMSAAMWALVRESAHPSTVSYPPSKNKLLGAEVHVTPDAQYAGYKIAFQRKVR